MLDKIKPLLSVFGLIAAAYSCGVGTSEGIRRLANLEYIGSDKLRTLEAAEARAKKLQTENESLNSEIAGLRSDPARTWQTAAKLVDDLKWRQRTPILAETVSDHQKLWNAL